MPEKTPLSDREQEILKLVATGLTNREIAQQLTISPNTVKVHLRNIFEKINVSSRTEATLYGIENGIVDVPGIENTTPEPTNLGFFTKYPWAVAAVILITIALVVVISTSGLFQSSTPETIAMTELAKRWQELAPLPEPRASMAAAAYDGDIYAIAGEGPQGVSGDVFRYITEEDQWEQLNKKPTPVADVKGAVIGERIFIPGGRLMDGTLTSVLEIYDPRQNTWSEGASLPRKISSYALTAYEGQIYLFGGFDGEKVLNTVLTYDPVEDKWEERAPMLTARSHAGAAEAGGKIFVIGGWDGKKALGVNESFSPSRDRAGENAWNKERFLPEEGYGISVQSLAGILFVLGEDENNQMVLYQFISQNNAWSLIDNKMDLSFDRNMGVVNQEGIIYVMGGTNQADQETDRYIQYQAIYTISLPGITN